MNNNSDELKIRTNKCMYGKWHASGKSKEKEETVNLEFDLEVGEKETKFTVKKNGSTVKDDTFGTSGVHWFGDYLLYTNTSKYFITNADDKHIAFGELSTPMTFDGKYELYMKLDRV